jgi:hypothetical protein
VKCQTVLRQPHKQRIAATQLPARRAKGPLGTLVELRAHDRPNSRRAQRPKRDPLLLAGEPVEERLQARLG